MKSAAALALAALAAGPALAQEPGYASATELEERLVGNTFAGSMGSPDYTSFFAEDGRYHDTSASGDYEITQEGVCYPGTDFGCYAAVVEGDTLTWYQDGESIGTGRLLDGDALDLAPQ